MEATLMASESGKKTLPHQRLEMHIGGILTLVLIILQHQEADSSSHSEVQIATVAMVLLWMVVFLSNTSNGCAKCNLTLQH